MSDTKTTWETLSSIDVSKHTEKKNKLTYLSWAWAWGIAKEYFPDANYRVINFDGKPYLYDENLGYLVQTEVTIAGETIPMHLFVMDGANKAMKHFSYEYQTKYGSKTVEQASMFDINKTIMRCLTKNLAMFGLGHYIFAGEDLPNCDSPQPPKPLPPCPQSEIDGNVTQWQADISAGKYTADAVINKISTKYVLNPQQVNQIRGLQK